MWSLQIVMLNSPIHWIPLFEILMRDSLIWDYNTRFWTLFFSNCALPTRGLILPKSPIHSGLAGSVASGWRSGNLAGEEGGAFLHCAFLHCAFSPGYIFSSVPFLQCVTFGGTEEGEPKKQKGKGLPTDIRPLAHQPTREHSQNMIWWFMEGYGRNSHQLLYWWEITKTLWHLPFLSHWVSLSV